MKFISVLYLTDLTTVETVEEMAKHPNIWGFKYYPAGATTNSAFGVTNVLKCYPVFEKMQELDLILCIHSEVSRPEIDIFDREKVFIDEVIRPLTVAFPTLKIVMEHISTAHGVEFVESLSGDYVKGSITPHHLVYNRNALLVGGLKPHFYCLPILKRGENRAAEKAQCSQRKGEAALFVVLSPRAVRSYTSVQLLLCDSLRSSPKRFLTKITPTPPPSISSLRSSLLQRATASPSSTRRRPGPESSSSAPTARLTIRTGRRAAVAAPESSTATTPSRCTLRPLRPSGSWTPWPASSR